MDFREREREREGEEFEIKWAKKFGMDSYIYIYTYIYLTKHRPNGGCEFGLFLTLIDLVKKSKRRELGLI